MSEPTVGVISLLVLLLLFVSGIELAFGMALLGFVGYAYLVSFKAACNVLVQDFFDTFTSYGFTVIPLFVLMGQIASNTRIAQRLYDAAQKFIGHVPGGLAMTTVVGATLFKAISGSTLATAATFSGIAIPEMERYGYNRKLSSGVVASVGTLGVLIPPSIVLIIYGFVVEQSIGRLFLAGFLPGFLIAGLFLLVVFGWAKLRPQDAPVGKRVSWRERWRALPEFLGVGILYVVVIFGLMLGIFSPTEAGTIGTIGVFVLALVHREVNFSNMFKAFDESIRTSCMVLLLIAGSAVYGHFLAVTEIPLRISEWVGTLELPRALIMVLIMFIYLLGGSFMDDLAFMILATPIFYPVVIKLGYDPIWFGIMICVTLMVGVIIPPVAVCVFVVRNITGIPFGEIYKGVLPFLLSLVTAAFLLFLFPDIATFLPRVLMGP